MKASTFFAIVATCTFLLSAVLAAPASNLIAVNHGSPGFETWVYATRDIRRGTVISEENIDFPAASTPMITYANHGCNPNVLIEGTVHKPVFKARYDIKAGEELTISYTFFEAPEYTIEEFQWLDADTKEDILDFECECDHCTE